jgi:DNA-binding response OmpR family regulator
MDSQSGATDSQAHRALVLHDRQIVVDLIELTLNHGLFVVRAAHNLAEAETILTEWHPHVCVVDMDHDDSGPLLGHLGASNTLRRSITPVLGLTRRGDLQTKLKAFDLGVDDILTVPFSPEELLARAIVITRRATGIDRPIVPTVKLGEIEIDIVNRQVRAGTSVVHLSGIEQSLLYLLASRGGQVVTREEALDAIWGTDFVTESNLVDRHIRSLRIKLQNGYQQPRFIATVPGHGYRFIPTFTNAGWSNGHSPSKRPEGSD